MISLIIMVTAAEGKAEDFLKYLTEEAADALKYEPKCRQFSVSRSVENDHLFTLAEFYDDEAALEYHRTTDHFVLFQKRVAEFGLIKEKTAVLGNVVFPV